jgi:hypothetical protein
MAVPASPWITGNVSMLMVARSVTTTSFPSGVNETWAAAVPPAGLAISARVEPAIQLGPPAGSYGRRRWCRCPG